LSNAPTPPAQTPVLFVKAGDTNVWFSPGCVKALQEAGLRPEWMGSYDHVAKLNAAARKKCADFDGGKPGATEPAAEERYLASCQSGHLEQNAIHQTSRDDPCTNVTPGYDMGAAPCMPQWGTATQKGGEHYLVSRHEENSAYQASQANPGGIRYSGGSVDAHSTDRLNQVQGYMQGNDPARAQAVHRMTGDEEEARKNHDQMMQEKAGAKQSIAATPGGAGSSSGAKTSATAPTGEGTHVAGGNNVAECLDNFRKAAATSMRQECARDVEKNKAEDAKSNRPAPPPPAGETVKERCRREERNAAETLDRARRDPTSTAEDRKKLADQYESARGKRVTATKYGCLARQGEELRGSGNFTGPYDGVIPSNAKPFGEQDRDGNANREAE
jgi:hypothetical protein